jgi:hypothetical protein
VIDQIAQAARWRLPRPGVQARMQRKGEQDADDDGGRFGDDDFGGDCR